MTNKEKYIGFCRNHTAIVPVFMQPFWLDAVAEKWEVVLVEAGEEIIGALPYCIKGNFITQRIYLPTLSFYQSFILADHLSVSESNRVITQLLKQLPVTLKSYFKLLPANTRFSLIKSGFTKEVYTTCILTPNTTDYSKLSKNHQRNIDKGIKGNYSVKQSKHIDCSYELLVSTFKRQHKKVPVDLADFKKLLPVVIKNNAGNIFDCYDTTGNLLASVFILKDKSSYYYSLGGYNESFKNSGGMTYLLWHCLEMAKKENLSFNFCGSKQKSISVYFKGFNAQEVMLSIWKKSLIFQ